MCNPKPLKWVFFAIVVCNFSILLLVAHTTFAIQYKNARFAANKCLFQFTAPAHAFKLTNNNMSKTK